MIPIVASTVQKYKNRAEEIDIDTLKHEMKSDLRAPYMREIMQYYFGAEKSNMQNLKKDALVDLLAQKVSTSESTSNE